MFLRDGVSKTLRKKLNIGERRGQTNNFYLSVVVFKENTESMHACNYLARRLKKAPKQVTIAGNKDKRGITSQRVTIHRCDAELLIRQQRCKDWDPKIKVGSFERVQEPLLLG